jgi:hypothetical protein
MIAMYGFFYFPLTPTLSQRERGNKDPLLGERENNYFVTFPTVERKYRDHIKTHT